MLRDPECVADVADVITRGDFYYHAFGLLFDAIAGMRARQEPVDLVTVFEHLTKEWREEAGWKDVLAELYEGVPTAANAVYYAEIVRDRSVRRRLIHAAQEIIRDAADKASGSAADLAIDAARRVAAAGDRFSSPSLATLDEVLSDVIDQIDLRATRPTLVIERPTGFIDLDQATAGLHPAELVVIGARPGVGKSALAVAIAESVARARQPVLFVSLEMGRNEQVGRMLVSNSGVANERVRRGRLSTEDVERLSTAWAGLRGLPVVLDDDASQTVVRIVATARKLHRKAPLGLIVIDYLQLIRPTDAKVPRHQQVAEQTRELKLLAKDLRVPVILLAQLNRDSEHDRRRPRLSDLKESGAIEQDADTVLLLHPEGEPGEDGRRLIEVCVAKQRNGPLTTVNLVYEGKTLRFANWSAGK
jgi:replicative DNA helicase